MNPYPPKSKPPSSPQPRKAVRRGSLNRLPLSVATLVMILCLRFAALAGPQVLSGDFQRGDYFNRPLFSFTYDGKSSEALLPQWKPERSSRVLDNQRTERRVVWTDPATGLEVRCVGVEYQDFPAVEWTVYFKNTGKTDSPILSDIRAIDTRFERNSDAEFVLNHNKATTARRTVSSRSPTR